MTQSSGRLGGHGGFSEKVALPCPSMTRRKQAEDLGVEHFRYWKAGAEALGEAGVVGAEARGASPHDREATRPSTSREEEGRGMAVWRWSSNPGSATT